MMNHTHFLSFQKNKRFTLLTHLPWLICSGVIFVLLWKFRVDFPHLDEWEAFNLNALDSKLNWNWIIGFHNEHHIVFTTFLTWLLYHLNGWDIGINILINFGLYFGSLVLLLLIAKKTKSGLFFPLAMIPLVSMMSLENLTWAFQSQFFFCLLFLLLAIFFGVTQSFSVLNRCIAILCLIACQYSFSAGIGVSIVLSAFISYHDKKQAVRNEKILVLSTFSLPLLTAVLWFHGLRQSMSYLTWPWTIHFWKGCLRLIGYGFGFENQTIQLMVGGFFLSIFSHFLIRRSIKSLHPSSSFHKARGDSWIALGMSLFAIAATLTLGRYRIHLCLSRYSTFMMLVIPIYFGIIYQSFLLKWITNDIRKILTVIGILLICTGYWNRFSYKRIISVMDSRDQNLKFVVQSIENHKKNIFCYAYPDNLKTRVDRALQLGIAQRWKKSVENASIIQEKIF